MLLLCGGDKSGQAAAIQKAVAYLRMGDNEVNQEGTRQGL